MNFVTWSDGDVDESNVFQADFILIEHGRKVPVFMSWEASRIAEDCATSNLFGPIFRWNTAAGEDGGWEYMSDDTTDGEWVPVEEYNDHGVIKYKMAPDWEWREVKPPVVDPEDEESVEAGQAWEALREAVERAGEAHADSDESTHNYLRGAF